MSDFRERKGVSEFIPSGIRCQLIRQSRPDYSHGFQVKVLPSLQVVSAWLGRHDDGQALLLRLDHLLGGRCFLRTTSFHFCFETSPLSTLVSVRSALHEPDGVKHLHPRKALRGDIQKSILKDFSGKVGNSRQMLTKTRKWLQERGRDTPTKGLLWYRCRAKRHEIKQQILVSGGKGTVEESRKLIHHKVVQNTSSAKREHFKDLYLAAKARIWPCLSYLWHIRSTAVRLRKMGVSSMYCMYHIRSTAVRLRGIGVPYKYFTCHIRSTAVMLRRIGVVYVSYVPDSLDSCKVTEERGV